jgi:hypothetical protein
VLRWRAASLGVRDASRSTILEEIGRMTLDEYLEQFIEGDLLEDLHSMAPVRLAEGKRYGAVGYPMVMTVLSGIEVLGVLISRSRYNANNGAARFGEFWKQYMYCDRPAFQRLDSLMYDFIRHGLAHAFMTKPMVRVTKHRDSAHLCRTCDHVLCVDALTLADDFEIAYQQRLRPIVVREFKDNMERRFHELRTAYWQERESKIHHIAKVPVQSSIGSNVTTRINSPSLPAVYSTNVSTTGFDDPNQ